MSGLGLTIKIGADTAGAIQGINRVNSALGEKMTGPEKFRQAVDKAFLPAVAALGALSVAGIAAVKSAEEAAQANARLGNIFSQMGYAEATDRVIAYAESLSVQIAAEDEVIKATQARLATFGEVAKTASEVGGAFDRATVAAFDLAAAGFGTAETNAIQLGKALQDPVKGLTALSRSGVTFTAAEKERIAALVESNKLGDAQAMILAAIEKQVGGTAAATAKGSDKMAIAFGEITEAVGMLLLPAFEALTPLVLSFAKTMQENAPAILTVAGAVGVLAAAVVAAKIGIAVYEAAVAIATAVQWAWNAAMSANPIGLIVIAIVALVAAVVLAYNNVEWFRNAVDAAWAFIQAAIDAVVTWFEETAWPIIRRVIDFMVAYYRALWTAVRAVWDGIYKVVETFVTWFTGTAWPIIRRVVDFIVTYYRTLFDVARTVWDGIYRAVEVVVTWFTGTALPAIRRFAEINGQIFQALAGAVGRAWDTIRDAIAKVVGWISDNVGGRIEKATEVAGRAFGALRDAVANAMSAVRSTVESAVTFVTSKIDAIRNAIRSVPGIGGLFSTVYVEGGGGALLTSTPGGYGRIGDRLLGGGSGYVVVREAPVVVNVNGALDPPAVARQIRRILKSAEVRDRAGGGVLAATVGGIA